VLPSGITVTFAGLPFGLGLSNRERRVALRQAQGERW
jgi:hypothetical protein